MKKILLLFILSLVCFSVYPQANRSRNKTKGKPKVVETPEQQERRRATALFEDMLDNTQKITIIDSVVVDMHKVADMIPLPDDYARIVSYNQFFGSSKSTDTYVFVNGFGNRCYYSEMSADSTYHLYTCDNLNGQWSKPRRIEGIDTWFSAINHPFMTSDGSKMYFSAKSKDGLGGYDIYVAGYDSEKGSFLQAENMGLPFNSFSDDFFYVEDDTHGLAWFASTRRQPAGKACIYTLLLSATRQNYDADDMDDDEIHNRAAIVSIRDTWESTQQRNEGINKLKQLTGKFHDNKKNTARQSFVIDDKTVYHSVDDFSTNENKMLYESILKKQQQRDELAMQLEEMRRVYHAAQKTERNRISQTLLRAEHDMETLDINIKKDINTLRKSELRILKKNNNLTEYLVPLPIQSTDN